MRWSPVLEIDYRGYHCRRTEELSKVATLSFTQTLGFLLFAVGGPKWISRTGRWGVLNPESHYRVFFGSFPLEACSCVVLIYNQRKIDLRPHVR